MNRAVLLLLVLTASTSLVDAADPWAFAASNDRAAAQKKHGKDPYYVHYMKAMDILKSGGANIDEAVALLRLAIADHPKSERAAMLPGRQTMEYFPYYQLAVAFVSLKTPDYGAARRCLQKESREISKSRLAASYKDLSGSIDALMTRDVLLAHVTKVQGWASGQGKVRPSSGGSAKIESVAGLAGRLRAAPPAEVEALSGQLSADLIALGGGEIEQQGALLAGLAADPWKGAFGAKPGLIAPGSCRAPGGTGESGVAATLGAWESCSAAVIEATRVAGAWGCGGLATLRGGVQKQFEALKTWAQREGTAAPAALSPVALPASCITWRDATAAEVTGAFLSLKTERPTARQALTAKNDEITAALGAKSSALRDRLAALRRTLPNVSDRCATNLRLRDPARRVRALRDRLAVDLAPGEVPDAALFNPDKLVRGEVETLLARLKSAVEQIQEEGGSIDDRPPGLDQLPGVLQSFLSGRKDQDLKTLCTTAGSARTAIDRWLVGNREVLLARIDRYVGVLDIATGSAGAAGDGPDCLQESLGALRRARSRPAGRSGAQQAQADLGAARACLEDFHTGARDERNAASEHVREARAMLDGVAGLADGPGDGGDAAPALAALVGRTTAMREDLAAAGRRLDKVAPLYEETEDPQPSVLRSTLEAAGLANNLPRKAWDFLETAKGNDGRPDREAWLVVRDTALMPELTRVARALDDYRPTIVKLGPFAALNRAFGAFAGGDLDGAILALRQAQSRGHLPEAGREAAMAHAALAFFLHTKALALSAMDVDERLTKSVHQDVQQHAKLAVRADNTFALPRALFRNESFNKIFEDSIQAETR